MTPTHSPLTDAEISSLMRMGQQHFGPYYGDLARLIAEVENLKLELQLSVDDHSITLGRWEKAEARVRELEAQLKNQIEFRCDIGRERNRVVAQLAATRDAGALWMIRHRNAHSYDCAIEPGHDECDCGTKALAKVLSNEDPAATRMLAELEALRYLAQTVGKSVWTPESEIAYAYAAWRALTASEGK